MGERNKNIDDLFREHKHGFDAAPSPIAWEKLEERLNKSDVTSYKNTKVLNIRRIAAIAVILVVAGSGWLTFDVLNNKKNTDLAHNIVPVEQEQFTIKERGSLNENATTIDNKTANTSTPAAHKEDIHIAREQSDAKVTNQTKKSIETNSKATIELDRKTAPVSEKTTTPVLAKVKEETPSPPSEDLLATASKERISNNTDIIELADEANQDAAIAIPEGKIQSNVILQEEDYFFRDNNIKTEEEEVLADTYEKEAIENAPSAGSSGSYMVISGPASKKKKASIKSKTSNAKAVIPESYDLKHQLTNFGIIGKWQAVSKIKNTMAEIVINQREDILVFTIKENNVKTVTSYVITNLNDEEIWGYKSDKHQKEILIKKYESDKVIINGLEGTDTWELTK